MLYNFILQFVYNLCLDNPGQYRKLMNALKITLVCEKHAWIKGNDILKAENAESLEELIGNYTNDMMANAVVEFFFFQGDNAQFVMACSAVALLVKYYEHNQPSQDTLPPLCLMLLPAQPSQYNVDTGNWWPSTKFLEKEWNHFATIAMMDGFGHVLNQIIQKHDLGFGAFIAPLALFAVKLGVAFCTNVEHPHPFDAFLRTIRFWKQPEKKPSPSLLRDLASVAFLYGTGHPVWATLGAAKLIIKAYKDITGQAATLQPLFERSIKMLKENPDKFPVVFNWLAMAFFGNTHATQLLPETIMDGPVGRGKRKRSDTSTTQGSASKRQRKGA